MRLDDNALLQNPAPLDHEQAHVPYPMVRGLRVENRIRRQVEAEVLSLQATAVAETQGGVEDDPLMRHGYGRLYFGAFWLIATLPRISAPAMPMLSVNGSPSSIHAHATANRGTR